MLGVEGGQQSRSLAFPSTGPCGGWAPASPCHPEAIPPPHSAARRRPQRRSTAGGSDHLTSSQGGLATPLPTPPTLDPQCQVGREGCACSARLLCSRHTAALHGQLGSEAEVQPSVLGGPSDWGGGRQGGAAKGMDSQVALSPQPPLCSLGPGTTAPQLLSSCRRSSPSPASVL